MKEINIERPFEAFNQHISPEDNQRILFSAPFGSGKTYFLRKYFESIHESTNAFWLSPVKYVVSQNEDIFEYIKYDLAYQLLEYEQIKEEIQTKYELSQYVYQYIINRPKDIFKLLFSVLEDAPIEVMGMKEPVSGVVGKVGKLGKTFLEAIKDFEEYKKTLDTHLKSTKNALDDYVKDIKDIKGSVFEDDLMSQMIRSALNKVKNEKRNVLIVDDLDRLDPEHIFRILNILSVHQDFSGEQNKFGFDKIIIVCDEDNIENIYKHKYGHTVDFNGYIEKFYSTSIFNFSNQQAVSAYCQSGLTTEISQEAKIVLGEFLSYFVRKDKVTVRSIVKHRISPIIGKYRFVSDNLINENNDDKFRVGYTNGHNFIGAKLLERYKSNTFYIESSDFEYLTIIKLLIIIFGNFTNLSETVNELIKDSKHSRVSDIRMPALKVIAPMQHLIENINQPLFLAISLHSNEDYSYQGRNIIRQPQIKLFNVNTVLNLKWSNDNPYTGEESFYSNINESINEDIINAQVERLSNDSKQLTMYDLMFTLQNTLSFLFHRDYLDILA